MSDTNPSVPGNEPRNAAFHEQRTKHLLTPSQVAYLYSVHPRTTRHWANKGLLKTIRTPAGTRRFVFTGEDIQKLLNPGEEENE